MHNALGGGRSRRMAVEDPSRGLMPWVGVAAPLDPALENGHAPNSPSGAKDGAAAAHGPLNGVVAAAFRPAGGSISSGRAFCFLPLPIYTGMPPRVHINGYFELSSNRRDIWCVCPACSPCLAALAIICTLVPCSKGYLSAVSSKIPTISVLVQGTQDRPR